MPHPDKTPSARSPLDIALLEAAIRQTLAAPPLEIRAHEAQPGMVVRQDWLLLTVVSSEATPEGIRLTLRAAQYQTTVLLDPQALLSRWR